MNEWMGGTGMNEENGHGMIDDGDGDGEEKSQNENRNITTT